MAARPQLDFLDALRDFTGSEFTSRDLRNFAVAADWDKERVRAAYDLYRTKRSVENPVGWMLTAIVPPMTFTARRNLWRIRSAGC